MTRAQFFIQEGYEYLTPVQTCIGLFIQATKKNGEVEVFKPNHPYYNTALNYLRYDAGQNI